MSGLFSKFLPFLGKISMFLAPLIDIARFVFGGSDEKKSAGASIGLGAIGAGIGTVFGGPIGAAIGYGIGSLIGLLTTKIFSMVGQAVVNGVKSTLSGIGSMLSGAGALATGAFNAGMTGLGDLKASLQSYFSGLGNAVLNGVNSFKDSAVNVYSAVTASFSNLGQTVVDGITSVFDALIQQAKDLISGLTDIGGAFADFFGIGGGDGDVADDFISRPGAGVQKFAPTDTVIGVRDPGILSALAGNRGMSESGTKQVALLTTLVNNSNVQMAEIIRTNKEITAAVNSIGRSSGA